MDHFHLLRPDDFQMVINPFLQNFFVKLQDVNKNELRIWMQ